MVARRKAVVRPDKLADFLETAYDLEADDQTWLKAVMQAGLDLCGSAQASHGTIYDASNPAMFRARQVEFIGLPEPTVGVLMRALDLFTPSLVTRLFRSLLANITRDFPMPELRPMFDGMTAHGFVDAFHINGLDPSGIGIYFALWTEVPIEISEPERALLRRMAHHLAAAHRVRRRLRESQPDRAVPDPTVNAEAILDPKRRVVHAIGQAQSKAARDALIATATARDRARLSRADPAESLGEWRPLTQARWTLVDSFESGGSRYIVARENQGSFTGLETLSDRERQVVVYVALGQSTKETAYALGISDATTRVLLARAVAKLGVGSRAALLDHPAVRLLRPGA